MGEPLRTFVVDQYHEVAVPSQVPETSAFFGLPTIVKGQRFQFDFNWIGRYGFYTVDIFDADGNRIRRFTPRPDVPVREEALFDDPDAPDAEFFIGDEEGNGNPILPATLSSGEHTLNVASGRLVTR